MPFARTKAPLLPSGAPQTRHVFATRDASSNGALANQIFKLPGTVRNDAEANSTASGQTPYCRPSACCN